MSKRHKTTGSKARYQVIYFPTGAGQYAIKDTHLSNRRQIALVYGGNDWSLQNSVCTAFNRGTHKPENVTYHPTMGV